MGDRVAVMDHGRVQQLAPPKETYRRPANRFVAEFIGSPSMNLLEGTVEDGEFTSDDGGVTVALPEGLRGTSGRVTLGIRPENVELADAPGDHTFTGEVEVIELLGNVQIVHFDVDGREFLAEVHPDVAVEQGERRHVRLSPDRVHLFDGVSPRSERIVPEGEAVAADD
jgi:ABC-type sugar transport system ATPase subunit